MMKTFAGALAIAGAMLAVPSAVQAAPCVDRVAAATTQELSAQTTVRDFTLPFFFTTTFFFTTVCALSSCVSVLAPSNDAACADGATNSTAPVTASAQAHVFSMSLPPVGTAIQPGSATIVPA